jgi:hypothetical protein
VETVREQKIIFYSQEDINIFMELLWLDMPICIYELIVKSFQ